MNIHIGALKNSYAVNVQNIANSHFYKIICISLMVNIYEKNNSRAKCFHDLRKNKKADYLVTLSL